MIGKENFAQFMRNHGIGLLALQFNKNISSRNTNSNTSVSMGLLAANMWILISKTLFSLEDFETPQGSIYTQNNAHNIHILGKDSTE